MVIIMEGTFIQVSMFFVMLNTVTVHLAKAQQTLIDRRIDSVDSFSP